MGLLHQLSNIDFYCCNRSVSQCITFMSRNTTQCCCLLFIFVAEHVTQCKVNQHEGQRDSGEMYSSYTFSVRYSPTHRMLKQKPCVTDLLTSCSGRLSNPTWPPKLRLRFSSFYRTHTKKKIYIYQKCGGCQENTWPSHYSEEDGTDTEALTFQCEETSKTFCSFCTCKIHHIMI